MGFKTDTLTAKNSGSSLTTNATSVDFNTNLKASVSGTDVTVDSIVDIVVTVNGNNKYVIDGVAQADIAISKGTTYRFDVSDSSNANHPFALSTSVGGGEYTTGRTSNGTEGNSGAYVQYTTSQATPDSLYYYCKTHGSGMGGNVHSGAVGGNITQLSDGKVGIGVASPSKALDVDGQIKVRGASNTSKIFGSHASNHAIAIDGREGGMSTLGHPAMRVVLGINLRRTVAVACLGPRQVPEVAVAVLRQLRLIPRLS
jgi:hypothetical protein